MRKYVTVLNKEIHLVFIALVFTVLLLSSALAAVYYTKTVSHQAAIVANGMVQTYTDVSCTQVLDNADWGSFNTSTGDDVKIVDLYIRNEGNVDVNVTWLASTFTSYNDTAGRYESSSWRLYLTRIEGSETTLRPENATTPDKVALTPNQVVHLRFYLTAIEGSAAEELDFQTFFKSNDN